jgi:hypothetical protein
MRRYGVSGVAWWLNDGYSQVVPLWASNSLGNHHQNASSEGFEGATRLPHVQVNPMSLPSALVSRLCDERPIKGKGVGEGLVAYLPLTNAPGKRDEPNNQLNIGVIYIQHP